MTEIRIAADYISALFKQHTPSLRYDGHESREEWQKRAHETLSNLLGLEYLVPASKDDFAITKEFDTEDGHALAFQFQSEPGYFVPCYLLLPKKYNGERLPACICIQGHSTGMHNSLAINADRSPFNAEQLERLHSGNRDFAVRAVKEGYAAFCIEQRYMGSTGSLDGAPGCAKKGQALPSLLLGRTAIGERVWDVMRLIDVICNHFPQFDTTDLLCLGNSGGGTTTFYAACVEPRIRRAMPSCAFCTLQDSIVDLQHCSCNYSPGLARYFDMGDLAGLIAPRDLVIVHGLQDDIFPDFGVRKAFAEAQRLYDAFGGRIVLVSGEGGHRFYADQAWEAIHLLNEMPK